MKIVAAKLLESQFHYFGNEVKIHLHIWYICIKGAQCGAVG
jgi:hypothetical protein